MLRLSYNSNNNELQESPIIVPNPRTSQQNQPPQSTKKVWRLKKYTKSEDELKSQQENYGNLEFNNKKSSTTRRPKNKNNNGEQEFVFVDLSPTKKKTATPKDESKKQGRVSRLFRLNNSHDNFNSNIPQKEQSAPLSIPSIPLLPPQQIPIQAPPALKRSYTTANAARYQHNGSSASLVMTVSESGRAVLQPTASRTLSNSSSVSDLFSLSRMNSSSRHYSPLPSPKRAESPVNPQHLSEFSDFDYERDDESNDSEHDYETYGSNGESDATKAFSKIMRKKSVTTRKRANTASSQNSNISSPAVPRLLTRNHSISSINSAYKARISPSRSNLMLRQTTLLQQQQSFNNQPLDSPQERNEFNFNSFFDDINNSRPSIINAHKKNISISDNLVQLGPPLEVNSSDNEPESPYTANTDVMLPFEFSETLDHTQQQISNDIGDDTLKEEDHQFFDFNEFVNYNDETTQF